MRMFVGPMIACAIIGCGKESPVSVPQVIPNRPFETPVHDPMLAEKLATLNSITGDVDAEHLESSDPLKSIVIRHSPSVPGLLWVLSHSESRNSRLGAVFALKEMGWKHVLHNFADDKDARVRTLVRAILTGPRFFSFGGCVSGRSIPPPYVLDPSLKEWALRLSRGRLRLSEAEARERFANVLPDFLGRNDPKGLIVGGPEPPSEAARRVAARDPVAFLSVVIPIVEKSGKTESLAAGIYDLTFRSWRTSEMYAVTGEHLRRAFSHPDKVVREIGIFAAQKIFPIQELELVLDEALAVDEKLFRSNVVSSYFDLARELDRLSLPEQADRLIEAIERRGRFPEMAGLRAELTRDRAIKTEPRRRHLRVETLIEVTEDEYQEALRRFGSPWLAPSQFKVIRPTYILPEERPPFPYG